MPLTQVSSRAIEDTLRYVLGASGTNHYTFTGKGLNGAVNDPTIYLVRGQTYIFENRSGGHPFYIKTSIANGGTNDAYNTGVTNNGGGNGTEIVFTVPHDAPDTLYYQCSSHSSMAGEFKIAGSVADGSITTSKLATDAVDNSKLADQAVTLDKLPHGTSSNDGKFLQANNGADPSFETIDLTNLSASNLSSGTVPDARIGASSVTQHVTAFDDNNIINDISALALKINALENATKYNTNSTSVDTFQDSNGITNLTNVSRHLNEYISSAVDTLNSEATLVSGYNKTAAEINGNNFAINTISANNWEIIDDATHTRTTGHYNADASREQGTVWGLFASSGQASNSTYQIFGQYTNTSSADVYIGIDTKANSPRFVWTRFKFDRWWATGTGVNVTLSGSNNLNGDWTVLKTMTPTTTTGEGNQDSGSFSNTTEYRYYQLKIHNIVGAVDIGIKDLLVIGKTISTSVSATGSFESNAITASASTSKMGAVITYQDFQGTATLNTDLKLYVSADNGSNYTQVTLVAQPDFATGVKMAKANDVTVTAGTQLKYKVEFANQSNGSKVTRVNGVSMQY